MRRGWAEADQLAEPAGAAVVDAAFAARRTDTTP